jgi:hypothetical protein
MRLEDLPAETRAIVQEIIDQEDVQCVQVSCYSEEGVMDLKNKACDALLAHRVDAKLKGSKINSVINRIHVAQPKARDDMERAPFIPDVVKEKRKYDKNDPERRQLLKDIEVVEGGAGVYNINMRGTSGRLQLIFLLISGIDGFFLQTTTCWLILSGRWTSSQRSWTARISQTSSIPTSKRNSTPWSARKNVYKQKVSTTAKKTW